MNLTKREREVIAMVWSGLASKDIAARQNVAKRTIDFHLNNIYRKLNVNNQMQACRICLQNKILSETDTFVSN